MPSASLVEKIGLVQSPPEGAAPVVVDVGGDVVVVVVDVGALVVLVVVVVGCVATDPPKSVMKAARLSGKLPSVMSSCCEPPSESK